MKTEWGDQAQTWDISCRPPLRPVGEELAFVREQVPATSDVVVLGVTPELTNMYRKVVAIDSNEKMIRHVWEGDSATKQCICADWLEAELTNGWYDAVLGDGSLSVLGSAEKAQSVTHRAMGWLRNGGKMVVRMYLRPEKPVQLREIQKAINGQMHSMKQIRRLIALHLAEYQNGIVLEKQKIDLLGKLLGHEMKSDSDIVMWFPNQREVKKILGGELKVVGSYPMAECFPYLVIRKE